MMAVVRTATLQGVDAVPVEVQADVGAGLPSFIIVGLGDTSVHEARERVRSAIRAAGYEFPPGRVVLNLAPAPLPKRGTGFDLPIAAAVLKATRQLGGDAIETSFIVGELSLDGRVRAVRGLLAHAMSAIREGALLIGPAEGAASASRLAGARFVGIRHLTDLQGVDLMSRTETGSVPDNTSGPSGPDLCEVIGHETARRALEICAAGSHNLLLYGPPGSGKTLLARCLCGILAPMTEKERISTALIHSVAGLDELSTLSGIRPFRSPHHSSTLAGLVGGGRPPVPGEASLAHNGVLFLDEMTEFAPSALQALRQPLEDGYLTLVRAESRVTYPARFTLVGATNPCRCGFAGDPERPCICSVADLHRFQSRLTGPLMDRIDLVLRVDRVDPDRLVNPTGTGESSARVRERVTGALQFGKETHGSSCTRLSGERLRTACRLSSSAARQLSRVASARRLSGRGIIRTLRVARTIADLSHAPSVQKEHVLEALAYRGWDSA